MWENKGFWGRFFIGCVAITAVGMLMSLFNPSVSLAKEKYEFVTSWGSYGSGDGQLYYPQSIAVDTNGYVYVADNYNRIQKFTSDGEFITKWSLITLDEDGDDEKEYWYVNLDELALAVDMSGNVYTTSTFMGDDYEVKTDYSDYYYYEENRLLKIAADGSASILRRPDGFVDIAVGPDGSVYLAIVEYLHSTSGEYSIRKFTSDDTYVTEWSVENAISDIEVDTEGNVYVIAGSARIIKYTSDGKFATEWSVYSDDIWVDSSEMSCVGVDASGNVYIGVRLKPYGEDPQLSIQKFTSDGEFITQFGSYGTGNGQFDYTPKDVAIDTNGIVYVLDNINNRVQKFALKEAEDETALIVNTTGDKSDADPDDGVADVDLNEEGNQCTLRAAIEEANRRSDEDSTITFDIPTDDPGYNSSAGVATISPKKPLPTIKKSVTIDATTQSSGKVEINGGNAGKSNGLNVVAGDCTIKGLIIKGFEGDGIIFKDKGEIYLSDMEITENCGWGIRATGNVSIGVKNGITVSQESTINNNGKEGICEGGGIWSSKGRIDASHIEVKDNGGPGILAKEGVDLYGAQVTSNKGPGIQTFFGKIVINSVEGFPNQVIDNKGYGIFSASPYASDSDEPHKAGVWVAASIEVSGNAACGIYAKGPVHVNVVENTSGASASTETSVVSNNGNGKECWVVDEKSQKLKRANNWRTGGIWSGNGNVEMHLAKVKDNGGPGILAKEGIDLYGAQTNSNKGPGIQTFFGKIEINSVEGVSNQVISNKGYGIFSASPYASDSDEPHKAGVWVAASIEVSNNAACGIYAKGPVYINDTGGITVTTETSAVSNNGKGTECWVITEVKSQKLKRASNWKKGGMWSVNGDILARVVEVTDNGGDGIIAQEKVDLEDATVTGNSGIGIKTKGDLTVDGGTICDNEGGNIEAGGNVELSSDVTSCD